MKVNHSPRFLMVCSGGGPGIMEAANRGASEAGGKSIGLNIKLPMEQKPNPYISPELSMLFRYFFMRKLWFAQPAQALIVFPGGFGTMDEMFEFLTLIQTHKMGHRVNIFLYGSKFWKRAINFGWLLESGTISREDLKLIRFVDSPQQAFEILKGELGTALRPAPPYQASLHLIPWGYNSTWAGFAGGAPQSMSGGVYAVPQRKHARTDHPDFHESAAGCAQSHGVGAAHRASPVAGRAGAGHHR